jgi:hypothetical protein
MAYQKPNLQIKSMPQMVRVEQLDDAALTIFG